MLKELAFSGGSFVMAGSFVENDALDKSRNSFATLSKLFISLGRIFFSTTMILFGYSHFLYTEYVSMMVPKMFGIPVFWTYLGGVALIGSGICVIFKIFIKPVAFLLAIMLFLWFILLHIPHAIADPYSGNGNKIVSAFDALLFCGVSLVIASRASSTSSLIKEHYKSNRVIE